MTPHRALVHIGLHKTGSTSLQHALAACRDALREQGFFYPVGYLPHRQQHSDLALLLKGRERDRHDRALDEILTDFLGSGCHTLILSGEEFSTLSLDEAGYFCNFLKGVVPEIRAILYVRNLYRFALSLMAQYSRGGDEIVCLHAAMARFAGLNPSRAVRVWENVAGPETDVAVACLEELPGETGLLRSFAAFAGVADFPAAPPGLRQNRSMDPVASALASHLTFEFGLSDLAFHQAYFDRPHERVSLPRTEAHHFAALREWVDAVDLSHPKLATHERSLRAIPEVAAASVPALPDYLRFLASVLTGVADAEERRASAGASCRPGTSAR